MTHSSSIETQLVRYAIRGVRHIRRTKLPYFMHQGVNLADRYGLLYVRLSTHSIETTLKPTLDLARFEFLPQYQKQGRFSHLLRTAERLARRLDLIVYVESIVNPELGPILERRGYRLFGHDEGCLNAWKKPL